MAEKAANREKVQQGGGIPLPDLDFIFNSLKEV